MSPTDLIWPKNYWLELSHLGTEGINAVHPADNRVYEIGSAYAHMRPRALNTNNRLSRLFAPPAHAVFAVKGRLCNAAGNRCHRAADRAWMYAARIRAAHRRPADS